MTVTAYAVVNGNGRIVKVCINEYQADRQQRMLSGMRHWGQPFRVVPLTGEVERVEGQKR